MYNLRLNSLKSESDRAMLSFPICNAELTSELEVSCKKAYESIYINNISDKFVTRHLEILQNILKPSVYLYFKDTSEIFEPLKCYLQSELISKENKTLVYETLSAMASFPFIFGEHLTVCFELLESRYASECPVNKRIILKFFFNLDLAGLTKCYEFDLIKESYLDIEQIDIIAWAIFIYSKNPEPINNLQFQCILYDFYQQFNNMFNMQEEFQINCSEIGGFIFKACEYMITAGYCEYLAEKGIDDFLLKGLSVESLISNALTALSYLLDFEYQINEFRLFNAIARIFEVQDTEIKISAVKFINFCFDLDVRMDFNDILEDQFEKTGNITYQEEIKQYFARVSAIQ